jgi:hypothetical protein
LNGSEQRQDRQNDVNGLLPTSYEYYFGESAEDVDELELRGAVVYRKKRNGVTSSDKFDFWSALRAIVEMRSGEWVFMSFDRIRSAIIGESISGRVAK